LDIGILPTKVGHSRQNRVCNLQIPGVRADVTDVLKELFEEAELVEVDPEWFVMHHMQTATEPIAQAFRVMPTSMHALMPADERGVDHEVGILKRLATIFCRFGADICAGFF